MRLPPDLEAKILASPGLLVNGRPAAVPAPEPESEEAFQAAVVELAKARGWRVYHTRDSRKSAAGFPDLVLVRRRVVWAELKSQTGRLTAQQLNWIEDLRAAGQEVYVWRPADWALLVEVLA